MHLKKSLEFKIILAVVGMLCAVTAISALMSVYTTRKALHSLIASSSAAIADVVVDNIETTMLEGRADVTRENVRHLKELHGFEEIAVFNDEGRVAFTQGGELKEAAAMNELKRSKKQIVRRDGSTMIIYMPLVNQPACQKCHTIEKPVLGAVKVNVSIEKELATTRNMTILMVIIAVILSCIFGALLWYALRKLVVKPVKRLESSARQVAGGDLSFDMRAESDDEIGSLTMLFQESFHSLGGVLQKVRDLAARISKVTEDTEKESKRVLKGAEIEAEAMAGISSSVQELNATAMKISDSTETLASSVEETSAAVGQMVSSISHVNDNIHDLSNAVESTSSSIEELSATIKQVAQNADELAHTSDETLSAVSQITSAVKEVELHARESARQSEKVTADAANFGKASIDKTIAGMENIRAAVEQTAELIRKLGGRSDEIGKILNVIDDITDQTTLLALNAAILAAQAGEHGKGFSVVADEIKDLAERTAMSTKEIASLIQSVQQEVKAAVAATEEGLTTVGEGMLRSREAGNALNKILESAEQSSVMAISIERSTTEQASAARLVSEAMERVRNMSDQIARATAEETRGILLIMKAAEKMKEATHQVVRATEEQTISSRQISKAIELTFQQAQQISRALTEHKIGTQQILNTVEGVKTVPPENRKIAFSMSNTLRGLQQDSELLKAEMARFKFSEGKSSALRFGIIPIESPAEMFRKFTPLAEYMGKKVGRNIELKVGSDFEMTVRDIGQNVTGLSYMGPATYLEAHQRYGVKVLVKSLREGKPVHHSVIITRSDSDIHSLEDLRGRTFAFGDTYSTTSYIAPRIMLKEAGIDLTDLRYYNHFAHHDEIVRAVLNNEYDAGAVHESTAYRMKDQGLRLLQFSEEIPGFNICYNPACDPKEVAVVKAALISLSGATPDGAAILKSIDKDCTGFAEAFESDYAAFRAKIAKTGIL